jgi:tetrahydromethanopterin S-methyltransferase subunit F
MIISFLKVLFFEYLQNIPSIIAIILAARSWKNSKKGIAMLYAVGGSVLSFLSIVLTEPILLRSTTLPPDGALEGGIMVNVLAGSIMFAVFAILFTIYVNQKWSNKKIDIIAGIVLAISLSLLQSSQSDQSYSLARSLSHTLAFIISFPITIILIRDAILIKSIKKAMMKGVVATLVMSVIIVIVDYGSFLI